MKRSTRCVASSTSTPTVGRIRIQHLRSIRVRAPTNHRAPKDRKEQSPDTFLMRTGRCLNGRSPLVASTGGRTCWCTDRSRQRTGMASITTALRRQEDRLRPSPAPAPPARLCPLVLQGSPPTRYGGAPVQQMAVRITAICQGIDAAERHANLGRPDDLHRSAAGS